MQLVVLFNSVEFKRFFFFFFKVSIDYTSQLDGCDCGERSSLLHCPVIGGPHQMNDFGYVKDGSHLHGMLQ